MEAFFISLSVVALAEVGDKTQLLAFLLAAQFKKPIPIISGILIATLINHSLAGALGIWITQSLSHRALEWVVGISFLLIGVWVLIPDEVEKEEFQLVKRIGAFGAAFITFFLAEFGDKTQVATITLAVHYADPIAVISGSTLGMLIADAPVVYFGNLLAHQISNRLIHIMAAGVFFAIAIVSIVKSFFH
jgi:putative Ca2+/H+ antiporter (TMEM165/GDT1 family)